MGGSKVIAHAFRASVVGLLLLGPSHALIAITPFAAPLATEPEPDLEAKPSLPRREAPPTPAAPKPRQIGNPLWGIPLKQLSATRERPIFSPSRRPPPPVVVNAPRATSTRPPPPPEPEKPALSLMGTVVSEREGIGLFVEQTTKNVIRLRAGENHKGWTLRSVQGREVTLEKNGETISLALPAPGTEKAGGALLSAALLPLPVIEQASAGNRAGGTRLSPDLRPRSR
jgi:hypothetical protein